MKLDKSKVVVGISGGVDSAVTLYLLKKDGFEVYPAFIKTCRYKGDVSADQKSAENVAKALGLELETLDARDDFSSDVVDYYNKDIKNGRTPSPCVLCNPRVKFKNLIEYADTIGARYVATGHYAKVQFNDEIDKFQLLKADDLYKDQTYSLSFLNQEILERLILPLGHKTKIQVYGIASQVDGLERLKSRPQSQDFCYLQQSDTAKYLRHKFGENKGEIVTTSGEKVGEHKGLFYYTIGQRKGIGLPGGPYYVVEKDNKHNKLVVSKDEAELMRSELCLSPYNLIDGVIGYDRVEAKLRDSSITQKADISIEGDKIRLRFDKPQRAVTSGQVAVLYYDDICLGSGFIV